MKTFFVIILSVIWSAIIITGSAEAKPKYVGVDGCKCHKSEIADWERSDHAKAFGLLGKGKRASKKEKANLDPNKDYTKGNADNKYKCLKCHTTGYEEEGGFQDMESTPNMAGIGCEMCHGAGSEYRELHKAKTTKFTRDEAKALGQTYGSIDISVCQACHEHKDSPFLPSVDKKYKFDWKEALKNAKAFHELYPLEGKH